jgi:hypothetical protein
MPVIVNLNKDTSLIHHEISYDHAKFYGKDPGVNLIKHIDIYLLNKFSKLDLFITLRQMVLTFMKWCNFQKRPGSAKKVLLNRSMESIS